MIVFHLNQDDYEKEGVVRDISNLLHRRRLLNADVLVNIKEIDVAELWKLNTLQKSQFCGDVSYFLQSRYQNSSYSYLSHSKNPSNTTVHKCTAKIIFWEDRAYKPVLLNIFRVLSEKLHFTAEIKFYKSSKYRSNPNIIMDLLRNKSIDCTSSYCSRQNEPGVTSGESYSMKGFIVVFKRRKFLNIKSVFLHYLYGFQWTFLVFSYLIIAIIVYLLHRLNRSEKDFVGILLDIWGTFYGYLVKTSNKIRFVLASAYATGLIMRTIYQGFFYSALTLNRSDNYPATLNDLIEGQFELLVPDLKITTNYVLEGLKKTRFNAVSSNYSTDELLLRLKENPYDTGMFADHFKVLYNLQNGLIDKRTHVIFKSVLSIRKCLFLQKNNPMRLLFDHYLDMMDQSGFPAKWFSVDWKKIKLEINKEPVQIGLEDIWIEFVFIGVGLSVSIVIFMLEIYFSSSGFRGEKVLN